MPKIFGQKSSQPKRREIRYPETSSHERGYTTRWTRRSRLYRQRNPFCAICLEKGKMTMVVTNKTGVVDHKHPVSEGGPMWDPGNWWSLCNAHHSGWKARLEAHAKRTGQMDKIRLWCDDPAQRPKLRGEV